MTKHRYLAPSTQIVGNTKVGCLYSEPIKYRSRGLVAKHLAEKNLNK